MCLTPKTKKQRGRPPVKLMPEPIPDTPENIARALLTTPPKKKATGNTRKKAGVLTPAFWVTLVCNSRKNGSPLAYGTSSMVYVLPEMGR